MPRCGIGGAKMAVLAVCCTVGGQVVEVKSFRSLTEPISSSSHISDFFWRSRELDFLHSSMLNGLIQHATHHSYVAQLVELVLEL